MVKEEVPCSYFPQSNNNLASIGKKAFTGPLGYRQDIMKPQWSPSPRSDALRWQTYAQAVNPPTRTPVTDLEKFLYPVDLAAVPSDPGFATSTNLQGTQEMSCQYVPQVTCLPTSVSALDPKATCDLTLKSHLFSVFSLQLFCTIEKIYWAQA